MVSGVCDSETIFLETTKNATIFAWLPTLFTTKKCVSLDGFYPVHPSDWIIFCPKTFKNAYFG